MRLKCVKFWSNQKGALCFSGHVHEESYNLINGIPYYSVNAVVDGDGPENNAYTIVDVYKDGSLKVEGFRRQLIANKKLIDD